MVCPWGTIHRHAAPAPPRSPARCPECHLAVVDPPPPNPLGFEGTVSKWPRLGVPTLFSEVALLAQLDYVAEPILRIRGRDGSRNQRDLANGE